jgi:3-deoxy-D-manno-octulosonic-acid transferase
MLNWMLRDLAYELFTRAVRPMVGAAVPLSARLGRVAAGKTAALGQLREWSAQHRDRLRPLIWFHAPSVGEALMAQAIVQALRSAQPDVQIAFTHFSPSAEPMRDRVGADVSCYLPWDTAADMTAALEALQPQAIAFVRTEIWPTLTRIAAARDIRLALVNAVLSSESSRIKPLARFALQPYYQRLDATGVINRDVLERFRQLGVPPERVRVTGDARFDQVWRRIQSLDHAQPLLERLRDAEVLTIVAGSTWHSDEEVLLPAFARFAAEHPARLLLAPHQPNPNHLAHAQAACRAAQLRSERLSALEFTTSPLPQVVLIDRLGVLADLYAIADLAFVGGAFQEAGVHSVVEPAALGVPVLLGPRHRNAVEAGELIAAGGGLAVTDSVSLSAAFREHLDTASRSRAGAAARVYVQSRLGGARANAELILELLATQSKRVAD